jgi:hypothetical protein
LNKNLSLVVHVTCSPTFPTVFTGVNKDGSLKPDAGKEPEIIVKISFPALVFELEVNLGSEGLQIGSISGWRFTYMKLIISKRLIGLSLQCKVIMDSKNPDAVDTFTGEVTVRTDRAIQYK